MRLFTLSILVLSFACLHHTGENPISPMLIMGENAPADLMGASSADILENAIYRRLHGDIEGATYRLQILIERFPDVPEKPDAYYQLGLCQEATEDFAAAARTYTTLVRSFPQAAASRDGWFRLALCQEYLGQHRKALKSLRHIHGNDLSEEDQLTLSLQRGISLIRAGRVHRGLARVNEAIEKTEGTQAISYLRAKAYFIRAEILLQEAARYDLSGGEERVVAELTERANLIARAEKEVAAAIRLEEPEWILEGMLALGRAYEALHDDLLNTRPPKSFNEEQKAIYEAEVARRARVLLTKAWRYYDEGITVAGRLLYEGRPLPELKAARDAIPLDALEDGAGSP